ncbi:unnamed protein product, partial [Effrenium voratum]
KAAQFRLDMSVSCLNRLNANFHDALHDTWACPSSSVVLCRPPKRNRQAVQGFNTLGLYLTKHGSAVLNALSYSILLPFTTALFFTPLLGEYQEPLTRDAYFTFVGLIAVLVGFAIYQLYNQHVGDGVRRELTPEYSPTPVCPTSHLLEDFLEEPPEEAIGQPSFQERVIGLPPMPRHHSSSFSGT